MKTRLPEQGWRRFSHRPEAVLLLCYYDPAGISTVAETVAFMQSESRFPVTVINLFEHRKHAGYLELHSRINLDRFAAVIIHNSVAYNVDNLRALDAGLELKLGDYRGVKVLMKQDENYRFRELAQYVGETGFDLILTCLPPEAIPAVYPPEVVGSPRFERMLTGYVTPTLRGMNPASEPRPVDIGYRGSIQPLTFGRLAYEKRRIGDDVKSLLAGAGMVLDISSRWEDRFGGDDWFNFLRGCKATLGAESGASIFDLDGDLDERCQAIEAKLGPYREDHAYADAFLAGLADIENNVHYHQISPRHFEAIATGTIQLLYPGDYSGLLVAGRHYFSLARDYSNLDEAIELIRDDRRRNEMARLAFEEVVLNQANWIESFVSRLDGLLDELLVAKGLAARPIFEGKRKAKNVLLLAAHEPRIDPRLGWVEEGARGGLCIHQLGVLPPPATQPITAVAQGGGALLAYPRERWPDGSCDRLFAQVGSSPAGMAGAQELLFIEHALKLPEDEFCELFGAPLGNERNAQFRWYLQYLLDTSITLLGKAQEMRGVHAVIATDLDTLTAALVLKGIMGIPVFYDAHEYWAEADVASFEYEKQFWVGMERRLVAHADYRQTVSPGLADLMSEQYGVPFQCLPNSEPLDRLLPETPKSASPDGTCRFLFLGGFAAGRGIDLLIRAWPETDERAILLLQGPNNAYKEQMIKLADEVGLLDTRIFFPAAVRESELIRTAAEVDVGLIPYAPTGTTYRYCCPNKMSQYMAAGLPILANETDFVASTVRAANCGYVANFARRDQLLQAIRQLMASPALRAELGRSGRSYFGSHLNWDVLSAPFYRRLDEMTADETAEVLRLFDSSSQQGVFNAAGTFLKVLQLIKPDQPAPAFVPACPPAQRSLVFRVLRRLWRLLPEPVRQALMPFARRLRA